MSPWGLFAGGRYDEFVPSRRGASKNRPLKRGFSIPENSLVWLGVIFLFLAAIHVAGLQWLDAVVYLSLGILMITTRYPIFGRGKWQTAAGFILAVVGCLLFLVVIARDFVS